MTSDITRRRSSGKGAVAYLSRSRRHQPRRSARCSGFTRCGSGRAWRQQVDRFLAERLCRGVGIERELAQLLSRQRVQVGGKDPFPSRLGGPLAGGYAAVVLGGRLQSLLEDAAEAWTRRPEGEPAHPTPIWPALGHISPGRAPTNSGEPSTKLPGLKEESDFSPRAAADQIGDRNVKQLTST